jgi:hypothetical protein
MIFLEINQLYGLYPDIKTRQLNPGKNNAPGQGVL